MNSGNVREIKAENNYENNQLSVTRKSNATLGSWQSDLELEQNPNETIAGAAEPKDSDECVEDSSDSQDGVEDEKRPRDAWRDTVSTRSRVMDFLKMANKGNMSK